MYFAYTHTEFMCFYKILKINRFNFPVTLRIWSSIKHSTLCKVTSESAHNVFSYINNNHQEIQDEANAALQFESYCQLPWKVALWGFDGT